MTSTSSLLRVDGKQAVEHLTALGYRRGDAVCVRYIHPVTKTSVKKDKLNFPEASEFQAKGFDVYVVINPGGHCDADIQECRTVFYEHDNLPLDIQLDLWQNLELPVPTIQVLTGGKSVHSYWTLAEPISPDLWRELQSDLLEFADADRSIKNPSRILRLAGSRYMKGDAPGGKAATIISNSGERYTYEHLRALIPRQQPVAVPSIPQPPIQQPQTTSQPQSATRYQEVLLPVAESIPLETCLSKDSRNLIQSGVGEGGRNSRGAALARDLIGTANYLQSIGQRFDGDPRQMLNEYAARCTPPLPSKEVEIIWRSAEKDSPTPACQSEGVDNCIRGWYWNNHIKKNQSSQPKLEVKASQVNEHVTTKLSLEEIAEQARNILLAKHPELTENIELEKLRSISDMSSYDWTNKIIKPLKRDLDAERFRLDLLNLLAVDDPIEQLRQQALLAPRYQMSSGVIDKALALIKQRTTTPATQSFNLDDFFSLQSQAIRWIVPGLLPAGETIILAGAPKSGKTLLAIDLAFAIATGESAFLKETVTQGRVLIISADESPGSTKEKLLKRGFRRSDANNVEVMLGFDISQIGILEKKLETFRPTLVIVDSLKRITHGQVVSENSAEFSDNIYTLKETFSRYNAAGILIHHTAKNQDAMGVGKIRGSSAIAGAAWGTWLLEQIPRPDPSNKKKLIIDPKDLNRTFSAFSRDAEGQQLHVELDLENNSWTNYGEVGSSPEAEKEKKTLRTRILDLLNKNSHLPGLNGREIIDLLGVTPEQKHSVYSELNRMAGKRLITCTPAPGDKRYNIYSLPSNPPPPHSEPPQDDDGGTPKNQNPSPSTDSEVTIPPPSPPPCVSVAYQSAESYTQQGFSVVSKIVSNQLADSKQVVEDITPDNYSSVDTAMVSEIVSNVEPEVWGGAVESAPDLWLSQENIQDMAGALSTCDGIETLSDLRSIWPSHALIAASKLLDAGKREQIKAWVLQLNNEVTPVDVVPQTSESSASVPQLAIGKRVRVGNFYGKLGAQTPAGLWLIDWDALSASQRRQYGEPPAGAIAASQIELIEVAT